MVQRVWPEALLQARVKELLEHNIGMSVRLAEWNGYECVPRPETKAWPIPASAGRRPRSDHTRVPRHQISRALDNRTWIGAGISSRRQSRISGDGCPHAGVKEPAAPSSRLGDGAGAPRFPDFPDRSTTAQRAAYRPHGPASGRPHQRPRHWCTRRPIAITGATSMAS